MSLGCPDCGGHLRLVISTDIDAEIQEVGAAVGNRVHNTFYRCDDCGGEFVEDYDDSESSDHGGQAGP